MLLLTAAALGQPRLHSPIREAAVCCLPATKAGPKMMEWESETTGMMAEEEPAMAEEERAPSLPVAEEREVEPTFSGEAMPEAAAEEPYAANEGAQAVLSEPLTNETLRYWVKRWCTSQRVACPTTASTCRTFRRGIRARSLT